MNDYVCGTCGSSLWIIFTLWMLVWMLVWVCRFQRFMPSNKFSRCLLYDLRSTVLYSERMDCRAPAGGARRRTLAGKEEKCAKCFIDWILRPETPALPMDENFLRYTHYPGPPSFDVTGKPVPTKEEWWGPIQKRLVESMNAFIAKRHGGA